VVVVSHDRWFLDRTVDRLFCFEQGRLQRFEGNYSAYLERRQALAAEASRRPAASTAAGSHRNGSSPGPNAESATSQPNGAAAASNPAAATGQAAQTPAKQRQQAPRRRSFKESRELERLDADLPQWESRRGELEALLASGGGDYTRIEGLTQELAALLERIAAAEERWLLLSELAD